MAVFPSTITRKSLEERRKKAIASFIHPKAAVIPASQIETFKKYLAGEIKISVKSHPITYNPQK